MRKVFDTVSHPEILTEAKPVSEIIQVIRQSRREEVPIRCALINGTYPTRCPSGKVELQPGSFGGSTECMIPETSLASEKSSG